MTTITSFRGLYNWLSNFHIFSIQNSECCVVFEPEDFPNALRKQSFILPLTDYLTTSSESIYMALKALYATADIKAGEIAACNILEMSTAAAKRAGKNYDIPEDDKIKLMTMALEFKFHANNELKQRLIKLKGIELQEGNMWHDNFWGKCICYKCADKDSKNNLGKLLMSMSQTLAVKAN
jgi:predicted NAD-dependent protein-ADP-ribosyltransferase YbiA (DUF1768 family)